MTNHILTSFPDRVTQQGILDVGLSDHQMIYCTRKITRIRNTVDGYENATCEVKFPNYQNFDLNDTYSNFI